MNKLPPNQFKITCDVKKFWTVEKADGSQAYWVGGRASGTNVDLDGEQMAKSAIVAFKNAIEGGIVDPYTQEFSYVPLRQEHRNGMFDILGYVKNATVDENNDLWIEAELDPDSSLAMDLWKKLNRKPEYGKPLHIGFSVAGKIVSAGKEWVESLKRYVTTFYEIALSEISVTSSPANPTAYVTALAKSLDLDALEKASSWKCGAARDLPITKRDSWDGDAAKARIFAWAGWDDDPSSSKARRAFLAYDSSNAEERGAYKLPFADVIDGELHAISSGIHAAASRLDSTKIPSSVKESAQAVLDHYRSQLGDETSKEFTPMENDETTEQVDKTTTDAAVTETAADENAAKAEETVTQEVANGGAEAGGDASDPEAAKATDPEGGDSGDASADAQGTAKSLEEAKKALSDFTTGVMDAIRALTYEIQSMCSQIGYLISDHQMVNDAVGGLVAYSQEGDEPDLTKEHTMENEAIAKAVGEAVEGLKDDFKKSLDEALAAQKAELEKAHDEQIAALTAEVEALKSVPAPKGTAVSKDKVEGDDEVPFRQKAKDLQGRAILRAAVGLDG
jgi:phage head maturation protease